MDRIMESNYVAKLNVVVAPNILIDAVFILQNEDDICLTRLRTKCFIFHISGIFIMC